MGGKTPSTAAASQLAHLSTKTFFESDAARTTFFKQLTEAMKTGGVGARIPIIERAVEAQSAAAGQAATINRQNIGRAGLSGTPFDVASQLGRETQASSQIAGIGPQIAAAMLEGAAPAVTSATGIPGLAAAANIKAQAASQGASNQAQTYGELGAAAGTLGAAAITSGAGSSALSGIGSALAALLAL